MTFYPCGHVTYGLQRYQIAQTFAMSTGVCLNVPFQGSPEYHGIAKFIHL